jgi:hypothetical protein
VSQSNLNLDQAITAPPQAVASAVQVSMFGGDPSKPVLQGQAGSVAGERGPGRPAGSGNKFNQDLVKMVSRHFGGRHVLDVLAELAAEAMLPDGLERIRLVFGCPSKEKAGLMLERILGKVIDATTPRLQHVKADIRVSAPVLFGDFADPASLFDDDGDLLQLGPNDYNDLGEGNG